MVNVDANPDQMPCTFIIDDTARQKIYRYIYPLHALSSWCTSKCLLNVWCNIKSLVDKWIVSSASTSGFTRISVQLQNFRCRLPNSCTLYASKKYVHSLFIMFIQLSKSSDIMYMYMYLYCVESKYMRIGHGSIWYSWVTKPIY